MLIRLILATLASYAGAQGSLSGLNSHNCSVTLAAGDGEITSPGYPGNSTNNFNCTYVFMGVRPTQTITIYAYELDLGNCSGSDSDPEPGCDCYWISIDGRQKLCPNRMFQNIYVFQDRFVIRFRSHGRRFRLRYSIKMDPNDNCTTMLTASEGEITSPGYPSYYINNLNCTYVIVGDGHNQIITIDFLVLDLYYCYGDWLIVNDGPKLCRRTTIRKKYVFRDRFVINFQSVNWPITINMRSSRRKGFKVHYSIGMDANGTCTTTHLKTTGQISTPCSSCNCTSNDCTNAIIGSGKMKTLSLDFVSLNFTTSANCDDGWFTIDGGPKICTSTPFKTTYAFLGSLDIVTHGGDRSVNSCPGFVVNYVVQDNCTTTLTAREGVITSPGYPGMQAGYLSCTYVIAGDEHAQTITIDLLEIDQQTCSSSALGCTCDWLIINDGPRLCYIGHLHKTYFFRDRFIIKFRTDYRSRRKGFKMHYSIGVDANDTCTSIHVETSGQISTPFSSCNCTYNDSTNTIIGSGKLQLLNLDFVSLNFTTSPNCDAGWFTIAGGPKICTSTPFKTIYAFFGSIDIVTNGGNRTVDSCPGFVVNYAVQDNCSVTLTAREGVITSPPDPDVYASYTSCTYIIVGEGDAQTIGIDLLEMDLSALGNCYQDWLIIHNGPKLCYHTTFHKTYVFRDRFIIKFRMHDSPKRDRFKIHYSVDKDGHDTCTSTLLTRFGQISTPCSSCNCTYNDCTNTIIGSGKLQTLTLDFVSLNFTTSPSCDAGWFAIDGGPKICTSTPFKTIYTFFGSLDIVIHGGDRSVDTCGGFVVNYAVQDVDNNVLTYNTNSGQLIGPSFPGTGSSSHATYTIVGQIPPQNLTLDITLTTFSSNFCDDGNRLTLNSTEVKIQQDM